MTYSVKTLIEYILLLWHLCPLNMKLLHCLRTSGTS